MFELYYSICHCILWEQYHCTRQTIWPMSISTNRHYFQLGTTFTSTLISLLIIIAAFKTIRVKVETMQSGFPAHLFRRRGGPDAVGGHAPVHSTFRVLWKNRLPAGSMTRWLFASSNCWPSLYHVTCSSGRPPAFQFSVTGWRVFRDARAAILACNNKGCLNTPGIHSSFSSYGIISWNPNFEG